MIYICFAHRKVLIVIVVVIIIILSGCATEVNVWGEAVRVGTIDSYEEYLEKYPEGQYAEKAKKSIDEIIFWEAAEEKDTIESYERYLDNFSDGRYSLHALTAIAALKESQLEVEKSWLQAIDIDSIEGYENFLEKFPGNFVAEAQERILALYAVAVLKGEGIDKAAEFNKNEPGPHKLVIIDKSYIDEDYSLHKGWGNGLPALPDIVYKRWMNKMPDNWVSSCISETVFFVIMKSKVEEIERCEYGHGARPTHLIIRMQHLYDIEIWEAKTGQMLDEKTLRGGMPEKCPKVMEFTMAVEMLYGELVSTEVFQSYLSGFVNP